MTDYTILGRDVNKDNRVISLRFISCGFDSNRIERKRKGRSRNERNESKRKGFILGYILQHH